MKLTANFVVQEFVSREAYAIHGDALASALNAQLAPTAQRIKDELSAHVGTRVIVTCNDWLWDGDYNESGLRDAAVAFVFKAKYSWHFYGCAMDLKFKGASVKEVYEYIMSNQHKFPYITRIENLAYTKTWLHVEVGNKPRTGEIEVFKPYD